MVHRNSAKITAASFALFDTMTPQQISLVTASWQKVMPISDTAAELFYGKLFEMDPALKPLFKGDMDYLIWNEIPTVVGNLVGGLAFTGLTLYSTHIKTAPKRAIQ